MSGNYFSNMENKANPSVNHGDDNRSSCVSPCLINRVLKYCLVIVTPYSFLAASTEDYEEGDYEEEEEEHFDNCTNQGKLIPMQAILVQASKDTIAIYLFREPYLSQVLILQAFTYFSKVFYSSPLSEY